MRAFRNSIPVRVLSTVLGLGLVAVVIVGASILTMDGLRLRAERLQSSAVQAVYAERINRLVAMVVMDSRGIYASRNNGELRYFADGMLRNLDAIDQTMRTWTAIAEPDRRQQVDALSANLRDFTRLRRELVTVGYDKGPDAARELGESNRDDRIWLNQHLEATARLFGEHDVRRAMTEISDYQRRRISLLLLISGLGLLAALAIAWMIVSRTMLRPLTALKTSVDLMTKGNLQSPVSETARGDEIGTIARSVEKFRHSLVQIRDIQAREHENDKQRIARAERIQRATDRFDQAIRECVADVHRSIGKVAEVADALRALATSSTQESQTLAGSAHEAALNAQSIASAAEQLQASVNSIFQQIERSSATAAAAAQNAEKASLTVDQLDGSVAKIGQVVALIDAIAEQTNLLALNATIESARAGEAGRGFGVVASEVKTLAQQTSNATNDIQLQIATVQNAARDAVGVIQTFEAAISDVHAAVSAITDAARQQNVATREITGSVAVSAQSVEAVSRGVSSINDGILRTRTASESATGVVASLKDQAIRLEQEVGTLLKEIHAA
ncbi:MAG: methyl-accepting chemotaxis protein [Pseudorhodoplanes sp.]